MCIYSKVRIVVRYGRSESVKHGTNTDCHIEHLLEGRNIIECVYDGAPSLWGGRDLSRPEPMGWPIPTACVRKPHQETGWDPEDLEYHESVFSHRRYQ